MAQKLSGFLSFILILITLPVAADQTDPRLDDLFLRLNRAGEDFRAGPTVNRIWRIWFETDNEEAERHSRNGQLAVQAELFDRAIEEYSRAIEAAPEFAEAWNRRATTHYLAGNFEDSLADIDKVLELEPRHFGALAGAGQIYLLLEQPEDALGAFRRAMLINPHLPGVERVVERLTLEVEGSSL